MSLFVEIVGWTGAVLVLGAYILSRWAGFRVSRPPSNG